MCVCERERKENEGKKASSLTYIQYVSIFSTKNSRHSTIWERKKKFSDLTNSWIVRTFHWNNLLIQKMKFYSKWPKFRQIHEKSLHQYWVFYMWEFFLKWIRILFHHSDFALETRQGTVSTFLFKHFRMRWYWKVWCLRIHSRSSTFKQNRS